MISDASPAQASDAAAFDAAPFPGRLPSPPATSGGLAVSTAVEVRQAEARFSPVGRFVTVGGVRLHYVEKGTGPPVVLLHGNPGFVRDFSPGLADSLAHTHRVLVFDRDRDRLADESRALHRAVPGSQLIVLPNTGHEVQFTRPAAVAQAIRHGR